MTSMPQNWHCVLLSAFRGDIITLICLIDGNVDLNHVIKVVSAGCRHCKVTIFPTVIKQYLGEILGSYENILFLLEMSLVCLAPVSGFCLQQILL